MGLCHVGRHSLLLRWLLLPLGLKETFTVGCPRMTAGRMFDLDVQRTRNLNSEVDIKFEVDPASRRYIQALNGATIAKMDKRPAGRDGCAAARVSTAKIHIDESLVGTYICARTNAAVIRNFYFTSSPGPPRELSRFVISLGSEITFAQQLRLNFVNPLKTVLDALNRNGYPSHLLKR